MERGGSRGLVPALRARVLGVEHSQNHPRPGLGRRGHTHNTVLNHECASRRAAQKPQGAFVWVGFRLHTIHPPGDDVLLHRAAPEESAAHSVRPSFKRGLHYGPQVGGAQGEGFGPHLVCELCNSLGDALEPEGGEVDVPREGLLHRHLLLPLGQPGGGMGFDSIVLAEFVGQVKHPGAPHLWRGDERCHLIHAGLPLGERSAYLNKDSGPGEGCKEL
mmetsp:Transcript_17183/g.54963  ORF Transcript_17183/g.54963 Transcript_17183/m.54963 type:complete len:218 (-) Transcript_17183:239-892(-)